MNIFEKIGKEFIYDWQILLMPISDVNYRTEDLPPVVLARAHRTGFKTLVTGSVAIVAAVNGLNSLPSVPEDKLTNNIVSTAHSEFLPQILQTTPKPSALPMVTPTQTQVPTTTLTESPILTPESTSLSPKVNLTLPFRLQTITNTPLIGNEGCGQIPVDKNPELLNYGFNVGQVIDRVGKHGEIASLQSYNGKGKLIAEGLLLCQEDNSWLLTAISHTEEK